MQFNCTLHITPFTLKQNHETMLFAAETLRALYLADNDFETLPADIGKLVNLQIVSDQSFMDAS